MKKILAIFMIYLFCQNAYAEYKSIKQLCVYREKDVISLANRLSLLKNNCIEDEKKCGHLYNDGAYQAQEKLYEKYVQEWNQLGCALILYK